MPKEKPTTSKPAGSEAARRESSNRSRTSPPDQIDDPIIIKGGSMTLTFDQDNFVEDTASPEDRNRKFIHGSALRSLKILRVGVTDPISIPLVSTDTIKVCYTTSTDG